MTFILDSNNFEIRRLTEYRFSSEGNHQISPQNIIASFPQVITDIPELEINAEFVLALREFSTERGSIDILLVTNLGEIILVETKLLRNNQSHREVVAQVIDYAKALTKANPQELIKSLLSSKYTVENSKLKAEQFDAEDDYFRAALHSNLKSGNFKVLIVGDHIHPNVLEMVDAIQSAPHLSFTIFMVEIAPFEFDDGQIIFNSVVITKTTEVERSVIKIEIKGNGEAIYDSEIPEKGGKGNKPILSQQQYLESIAISEFAETVKSFWDEWIKIDGDINMGTVGFSAGYKLNEKRQGIQYAYQNEVFIISERYRTSTLGISDELYTLYKDYIKKNAFNVYTNYILKDKVMVPFNEISNEELKKILYASFIIIGYPEKLEFV